MRIVVSLLVLCLLSACGGGSPMGVEYRAPPSIDPARKAAEDQMLQQRIMERSRGQEAL